MQKSESIAELTKALICFHVKMDSIVKDAKNPFFKSTYASLQNIQDAIREPLIESGLTVCQFPESEYGLTTILAHESGEWICCTYYMQPVKNDPQGIGSCITYQKRYALASALNLSISDPDDDGNYATFGGSQPAKENKQIERLKNVMDDNRPWLNKNTKEYLGAMEKLKAGTTTIEKIKEHFKLSKEIEGNLKLFIQN